MHHLARTLVPVGARHLLPRAPRRVLVIGGGPTGLFCADRLRHHFEVTLVDAKEYFEFTPGILRALGDPSHLSRITFDYREVLENNLGVEFVCAEATRVDVPHGLMGNVPSGRGGAVVVAPPMGKGDPYKLSYDYCVVAVGVSNGFWKPRVPGILSASGTSVSPPLLSDMEVDESSLEERRQTLRMLRERLATAKGAVVVGAGLVGVELASELTHFFPRLAVTLVDGAPKVLPQLAESAREYAHNALQQQGVKMRLGLPFSPEAVGDDQVVLWCVGTKTRSVGLLSDPSTLTQKGQVRVNRRMQVLQPAASNGANSAAGADSGSAASEAPVEWQPWGQGRIFAVGDCAAVEGVPTAQMIFHGEEMAAVAVASIEAAEDISSPLAFGKTRREVEQMPLFCNTSLGPLDGMFSTQSELLATGTPAAMQKHLIEASKMSALRGELIGTLAWLPVH